MAAKVTLDGGKLVTKDLKSKGKEKLKLAKQMVQQKQSTFKNKTTAITDAIVRKMEKEKEDTDVINM